MTGCRDEVVEVGEVDGRRVALATVRDTDDGGRAVVELDALSGSGVFDVRVPADASRCVGLPARRVRMTRAELRALVLAVGALDTGRGGR